MRLFIGLWPEPATAHVLQRWAQCARSQCGGRLMQPQDMHLTLAFLGPADPDQCTALIRQVKQWPVPVQPLLLERFGAFERARVVWAGPGPEAETGWLTALHDELWDRLQPLGWQRPQRPFRPHISLLRTAASTDISGLQAAPVLCRFTHCQLVASQPEPGRSRYRPLAQLPVGPVTAGSGNFAH